MSRKPLVLSLSVLIPFSIASAAAPPTVTATQPLTDPPAWALLERQLFAAADAAEPIFLAKVLGPDGTPLWPADANVQAVDCHGVFEGFYSFPLYYLLGGGDRVLRDFHNVYDASVEKYSHYRTGHGPAMIVKEFQAARDWFHLGEGYYGFRMLCLADPANEKVVRRIRRFAGFYLGEDPEAANWDAEHKIIRCGENGAFGPGFYVHTGEAIWTQDGYGLPFYDVPGCRSFEDLADANNMRRMAAVANARRGRGDIPQNLCVTSIVTLAYAMTGEAKYRDWVLDYAGAWRQRTADNGGILPDSVGLDGKVGQYIDGKWYGGLYGWTWPHGWENMGAAQIAAAQNALLVSGDANWLAWPRGQVEMLISKGIEQDGTVYLPFKHADPCRVRYKPWPWFQVLRNADGTALERDGWFEFKPMKPWYIAWLWNASMSPQDAALAHKLDNPKWNGFAQVRDWQRKDRGGNEAAWMAWLDGKYESFPEDLLRDNLARVYAAVAKMRAEPPLKAGNDFHYILARNPIVCEALTMLTTGGTMPVYNGGNLVTRLRHFDPVAKRPGLPTDVAALVTKLSDRSATLELVNLSLTEPRELIVQAGGMAEHRFTTVRQPPDRRGAKPEAIEVDAPYLHVVLPPATRMTMELGMQRYVNAPTAKLPW